MSKKKLVIFTCFGALLGCTLYFFDLKRSTPPTKDLPHEKKDVPQKTAPQSRHKSVSNFNPSYPHSDKRETPSRDELQEQLQDLKKFCEEEFPQYKDIFPSVERLQSVLEDSELKRMWLNIHLKDGENRVWRLRRFIDDGPNGEIERVVLYKEDETGFPRIVESSEKQKKESPSKLFQQFLNKGEPIFTDEAYSNLVSGVDYFFELTNGQITRIDVTSTQGHINCQVPH